MPFTHSLEVNIQNTPALVRQAPDTSDCKWINIKILINNLISDNIWKTNLQPGIDISISCNELLC